MARDGQIEPLGGRLGSQGQNVSGAFGRLNEHTEMAMILEELRELDYPVTEADLVSEALRGRLPPQLADLLNRMPEREYVSPEDMTEEAERPR